MKNTTQQSLWMLKHELNPFLTGLAAIVHYDLSVSDIDAIGYGIINTSDERDLWWTCRFSGKAMADLSFALDEEDRDILFIRIDIEEVYAKELALLIFMIDTFELNHKYPLH